MYVTASAKSDSGVLCKTATRASPDGWPRRVGQPDHAGLAVELEEPVGVAEIDVPDVADVRRGQALGACPAIADGPPVPSPTAAPATAPWPGSSDRSPARLLFPTALLSPRRNTSRFPPAPPGGELSGI